MEIGDLSTYTGTTLIVLSLLFLVKIQIQNAKKSGIYGSLFNNLGKDEWNKTKLSFLFFVIGVDLIIVSMFI